MHRIVSLIASATEIVDALGEIENLVGRSHECDYPPRVKSLPVCTRPRINIAANSREIDQAVKQSAQESISIYDVYEDVLERLEPTHIVTQIQCDVCAVSLRDVEAALARGIGSRPRIVSLQPDSLARIWDDFRRVAEALGIPGKGESVLAQLQQRVAPVETASRPRVACIEWIEPLMAAGNWMPELISLAGGISIFGQPGIHSPWMTWEELVASDPDIIIVAPCGFDLARTESELYWLTARPGWRSLRAVACGRAYFADGNLYFNRPGPRVVETFEILKEILHPELVEIRNRPAAWRAIMSM